MSGSPTFRVIDPRSLSFESIRSDLLTYVQSRDDADTWKDFYESGTGTTIIEMLAGLGAFLAYHGLSTRREAYLDTCKLYSSAIRLSNMLGYPVNRVANPHVRIQISSLSSVPWVRSDPIGEWNGKPISLLGSDLIQTGVHDYFAVIGEWNTFELISDTAEDFTILKIFGKGIDNNVREDTVQLWLNSVSVDLVKFADELTSENVLVRTDIDSILLIFGDAILGRKLENGMQVRFDYVTGEGRLGVQTILPDEVELNFDADVLEFEVLDPGSEKDSLEKLHFAPSGYYATKRRMCSAEDHNRIAISYSGDWISANNQKKDGVCCTVQLAYLFQDEHFISPAEEESILNYLEEYKIVGVSIELVDPVLILIDLKATVIIEEGFDPGVIRSAFLSVLRSKTWRLGGTFHIGEVVAEVANIPGVVRVYMEQPIADKVLAYNEYLRVVPTPRITITTDRTRKVTPLVTPDTGYIEESLLPLISPANNATVFTDFPTFSWEPVIGAVSYELWIMDKTNVVPEWFRKQGIEAESFELTRPLVSGDRYRWWVRSYDGTEWGVWSQGWEFTRE